VGSGVPRGDEIGAVRLLDESDDGDDGPAARSPSSGDRHDLAPSHQVSTELVADHAGHAKDAKEMPIARSAPTYRAPSCQDLPSVTTDGA
jgi:hypothetical protein